MHTNSVLKTYKLKLSTIAIGLMISLTGCNISSDNDNDTSSSAQTSYLEKFRPQLQYSAAQNWLNDPNGLLYFDGEYHLFYQYNPNGNDWGNMSWGHAVSTDLVHWDELPVALKAEEDQDGNVTQMFFSGSAVIDTKNTSGLGTNDIPAMVAIYTSYYPAAMTLANGKTIKAGTQAQSLAYSLDKGRTWTQYAGNPVIEQPPAGYEHLFKEFRDPKVFWYEPEQKWVMVAVLSTEHKAVLYESENLIDWEFMSEFGPANAIGGVWECPDLFEMPIDDDPSNTKWILVINLNPGGPAGGSGSQYFIGEFDGTTFTADDSSLYSNEAPVGTLINDFEAADETILGWTATGDLAKSFISSGNQQGQSGVSEYQGNQLVNTFTNGDGSVGTITSPTFTITDNYINFLVGGGNHARNPEATLESITPTGELLFAGADFEGADGATYAELGWIPADDLVGQTVPEGALGDQQPVSGYMDSHLANTFMGSELGVGGDVPMGTLTSPVFTITKPYINFLIGGGNHPYGAEGATAVVLMINGKVVRTTTGNDSEDLTWNNWDVSEFQGQQATIMIVDENSGGWGHINVDHFISSNEPARPVSTETTVNLIVDGKTVLSDTGANSEVLAWHSWNVASLVGKQAQIRIVDNNTGGWGHLLVDHIIQSAHPKQIANWSDYGSDFYAAVSWNGVPDGKRLWLGWMSNWNYSAKIPSSPWRSAQTFVREMKLQTINGELQLTQTPVDNLSTLRNKPLFKLKENTQLNPGDTLLADHDVKSQVFEIEAEISPAGAENIGFKVRTGRNGEETIVGYDSLAGAIYIDRTKSGDNSFAPSFAALHSAPFTLQSETVKLHIIVDTSSITVFGGDGEVVLTDQIFPDPSSIGMEVFAKGGAASLKALTIWPLTSIWANK